MVYSSGYESICRISKMLNVKQCAHILLYMHVDGVACLRTRCPFSAKLSITIKPRKISCTAREKKICLCRFYHAPITMSGFVCFFVYFIFIISLRCGGFLWDGAAIEQKNKKIMIFKCHSQTTWKFSRKVLNIAILNCVKRLRVFTFCAACLERRRRKKTK